MRTPLLPARWGQLALLEVDSLRCTGCALVLPVDAFSIRRRARSGRSSVCRRCKADQQRRWYERHRAEQLARVAARRTEQIERNRKLVRAAKDRPCADCGQHYPWFVMDLDHVRGEKRQNVSVLVAQGVSARTLVTEIAKCDVVCANCHRKRTLARGFFVPEYPAGPWSARNRQRRARNAAITVAAKDVPCVECGARYPSFVMDFDHVRGRKQRAVARLATEASTAALLREIAKCEVVCANCHRLRTMRRARARPRDENASWVAGGSNPEPAD